MCSVCLSTAGSAMIACIEQPLCADTPPATAAQASSKALESLAAEQEASMLSSHANVRRNAARSGTSAVSYSLLVVALADMPQRCLHALLSVRTARASEPCLAAP